MPLIQIHYDFERLFAGLLDLARDQAPFAMSQTLNEAIKLFQRTEQSIISENFTLRHRQFILNGVYISHFCHKRDSPMFVQCQIESRRDFMNKFEEGETKQPRGAHLAIPMEGSSARPGIMSIVPNELRPKALGLAPYTTKSGAVQWKGTQRTFLITRSDGLPAILRRTGPGAGDVELLFTMKTQAPTPASLHFQETARGTIIDFIDTTFPVFFKRAMATAK